MKKTASVIWHGNFKDGKGSISTQSGVLANAPYGVKARFENGPGTNPEELVGAAHASCFTMALALALQEAGFTAESLQTTAEITLDKDGDGYSVTASYLTTKARIPNIEDGQFQKIAEQTKKECPISKLLKAEILLTATLL